MSWSSHLRSAQDFLKVGQEVECVVLAVEKDERKLSLGMKQLSVDPWEGIEGRFPVQSKHTAKVRAFTNFGVFCELAEGIDGLVHISDLSWSKKIKHPSEFCAIGDNIEVMVMELDKDNRKISLGHKQIEENPWDVFETVFTEGSRHQGTIIRKEGSHAIVSLPYGLEGFCLSKNMKKEDGSTAKVEDTLDFVVLEFNKNQRKIAVSHTGTFKEEEASADSAKKPRAKKSEGNDNNNAVKAVNAQVEKSTLGDIDALAALKEKMEGKGE
jgi:small subunit ribosomal protein S1